MIPLEAARSSKILVSYHITTQNNTPADHDSNNILCFYLLLISSLQSSHTAKKSINRDAHVLLKI